MAFAFVLGALVFVLVLIVPTALVLGLLVVFALRTDPDEAGGRASALYLSMASFVAMFTALAAVVTLSAAIVDLVAEEDAPEEASFEDVEEFSEFQTEPAFPELEVFGGEDEVDADDTAVNTIVASLIVLAVAGGIYVFHAPRLDRVGAAHLIGTGAWRTRRAYRLVACLVAVLIVLVTASVSLYGVYSLVTPDTAGVDNRGDVVETLIPVLVLLAGAAVIFRLHWDDEKAPPVTAAVAP